jgi:hypothetical protein
MSNEKPARGIGETPGPLEAGRIEVCTGTLSGTSVPIRVRAPCAQFLIQFGEPRPPMTLLSVEATGPTIG